MKNKIILFLVLLIPSLCFGKSLRIELKDFQIWQGKNYYTIAFTYSKENGFHEYETFEFIIDAKDKISVTKSNEEKWAKLNLTISDKLKLKTQSGSKKEFHGKIVQYTYLLERRFLELLIGNDWMISEHNNDGKGRINIFAYKQDK